MPKPSNSPKVADFRDLRVWQMAVEFAATIYTVTRDFPSDERFGLTNQLRRAAVSISANTAEGNGRFSRPEYRHFVSIARGSTAEVQSELHVARRLGYLSEETLQTVMAAADDISRMLGSLHRSLR